MAAATAELAYQTIDMPICLDWATEPQGDHHIFPNFWEPAQFSDPVWRAYADAPLPTDRIRIPSAVAPDRVNVRSALRNHLCCQGWRMKLYTPVFNGRYAFVVVEDAVVFSIYAFSRDKDGWRLVRSGTAVKDRIVI